MIRLLPAIIFFVTCTMAEAQVKKRKAVKYNTGNKENPFLQQQWWIGLKGGINATTVSVDKTYTVITPTNYSQTTSDKVYEKFKPFAPLLGLEATYFFRGVSLSFQPSFTSLRFSYQVNYSWFDPEDEQNRLELNYNQEQQASYIILPLLLKYEKHFQNFAPYVQVGAYSARLLNATKISTVTGTDYASGGTNHISYEPVSVGAKDLFASAHWGFIAGAGLYYNIGNIRLNLDFQYKIGQSLINSTEKRYNNDRLSGIGDAMDDIKIKNVAISAGTLFPLRFLSSGFKSYDK